jgi:hypothetical protein
MSPALRWMAVLCLLLVSLTAMAQAMHFHADDAAEATKHCSVCLALHSVTPAVHAVHFDFALHASGYLLSSAEPAQKSFLESASLFSRPPPLV